MTAVEPAVHCALTAMCPAGGPIFSALATFVAFSSRSFLMSVQASSVAASLVGGAVVAADVVAAAQLVWRDSGAVISLLSPAEGSR